MTDKVTTSLAGSPDPKIGWPVGYEFYIGTDHCVVGHKEWEPACRSRPGFWWYTFTRTPLPVQKMDTQEKKNGN